MPGAARRPPATSWLDGTIDSATVNSAVAFREPTIAPEDELICLGHGEDLTAQSGALSPPIVQTSLFAYPSFAAIAEGLADEFRNAIYTRGVNPTVASVETKLAQLERGEACKCFASGMGAVSAVLLGLLQAGDHVLFVNQVYGPTLQLARHLERFGVEHSHLVERDLSSIEENLRSNTKIVWTESPGTMLFHCVDLRGLAALAKDRGILSVIDNSWATPLFQKPITLGFDVVVHSATKYIGGHSDVVAGALITTSERLEKIFFHSFLLNGAALGPFDSWLLNRGLRTLPLRMRTHHQAGLEIADFLNQHPSVTQVFHPGLEQRDTLPEQQLTGYSGLLSFQLAKQDFASVQRCIDKLELFLIGVSWGGIESLVLTPMRADNRSDLDRVGLPQGLIRLSIGHEPVGHLIKDLDQALTS